MATTTFSPLRIAIVLLVIVLPVAEMQAQPTYKLGVKPHLKPLAQLTIKDGHLERNELSDDPGFRCQYHFRTADGKTVTMSDARAKPRIPIPSGSAGEYRVVLELFYPAYKNGTATKGEFKPVSKDVAYRLDAAGKVTLLDTPPQPPADQK
jgi:hypothetical protein